MGGLILKPTWRRFLRRSMTYWSGSLTTLEEQDGVRRAVLPVWQLMESTLAARIARAIDAFLDWRALERDGTARSIDSYRRILWKLATEYPEARLDELTTADLRAFVSKNWLDKSASTRSNVFPSSTRSSPGRRPRTSSSSTHHGRSGGRRSGRPTSTGQASKSSGVSGKRRSRTSCPRLCSWRALGSVVRRWSDAAGLISISYVAACAFCARVITGTRSLSPRTC